MAKAEVHEIEKRDGVCRPALRSWARVRRNKTDCKYIFNVWPVGVTVVKDDGLMASLSDDDGSYFAAGRVVEEIRVQDVVRWSQRATGSRLLLPPIQRSAVWNNAQIINYWDSLLRGYPAGLMLVHPSQKCSRTLRGDGGTIECGERDFDLFDGQQRLTSLLLGFGYGQLNSKLKLWCDLTTVPNAESGLLFSIRISSSGQPFGYRAELPREKFPLSERAKRQAAWLADRSLTVFRAEEAFRDAEGKHLIGASDPAPVPLAKAVEAVMALPTGGVAALRGLCPCVPLENVERFAEALTRALWRPILFQMVEGSLLQSEKDYVRYFERLGQGGTRLTDDELTYSIIKHHHPKVSDCMKEVMEGSAGRIVGEVNLVLASLRVAKVISGWDAGGQDWKLVGRPYPGFVSELKQDNLAVVRETFLKFMEAPNGLLKQRLETLRKRLEFDLKENPVGLPRLLLARLPHQLVDVLLLRQSCEEALHQPPTQPSAVQADTLSAFVLFWLLFVSDSDKAATHVFRRHLRKGAASEVPPLEKLVAELMAEGLARNFPRREEEFIALREEVARGNHRLRIWAERFTALDGGELKPGEGLRVLTVERELTKRALLWLQRDYLTATFPDFDPTSNRDEDLPVDLDHLIPDSKFGFHWSPQRIEFNDTDGNFRWHRGLVGNSLGNFRWLDASVNRRRGNDIIEGLPDGSDHIGDMAPWNALIEKPRWALEDVAEFQRLIDLRSLALFEKIVNESQLRLLLP